MKVVRERPAVYSRVSADPLSRVPRPAHAQALAKKLDSLPCFLVCRPDARR